MSTTSSKSVSTAHPDAKEIHMPTTSFTATLRKAEEDAMPKVLASQSTLAAAVEADAAAGPAVDEATEHLAEIEAGFYSGSGDHTPAEHAEAVSAVRCAELTSRGARRRVEDASRGLRTSDTRLSQALVRAASKALPGVKVLPTFVVPATAPRAADRPVVLVVQRQDTVESAAGSLSGEVELVYYRTSVERPLDAPEVTAAGGALGLRLRARGFVKTNDGADTLRLTVDHAHDRSPHIPEITSRAVEGLGLRFAHDLADRARYAGHAVARDVHTGLVESSHLTALPLDAHTIEQKVDDQGNRTLTVEAEVVVRSKVTTGTPLVDHIGATSDALDGTFLVGLGLVESMEVEDRADEHATARAASKLAQAEQRTRDAAEIGFEDVNHHVLTVRAVLTSLAERTADAAA